MPSLTAKKPTCPLSGPDCQSLARLVSERPRERFLPPVQIKASRNPRPPANILAQLFPTPRHCLGLRNTSAVETNTVQGQVHSHLQYFGENSQDAIYHNKTTPTSPALSIPPRSHVAGLTRLPGVSRLTHELAIRLHVRRQETDNEETIGSGFTDSPVSPRASFPAGPTSNGETKSHAVMA